MAAEQSQTTNPWWAEYPEVKASCRRVEAPEVKDLIEADEKAGLESNKTFLLVDVRRTDWEGGTIKSSINFPAQTLYQTRPIIHRLCKQAGVRTIIFYCGSSNGRGPRSAGWMQDYLNEIGETDVEAVILTGGIKGWVKAYGSALMDWYDEKTWAEYVK